MKSSKQNRPKWFVIPKWILRIFIRRPAFVFAGRTFEEVGEPFILLSNHVGAGAPLRYELYLDVPFRFWGTHEMLAGTRSVYHYLADIYLLKKKHFPAFFAKTAAFIICPFVSMFYQGLRMIPTYPDGRFRMTMKESIKIIGNGENLIIFPEDSADGYHDELTSFFSGFTALAYMLKRRGTDVLLFCAYYRKKDHTVVVGEPARFSEIRKAHTDRNQIARMLCEQTNRLADFRSCERR